jgi:Flp pilus assembly protein TadG
MFGGQVDTNLNRRKETGQGMVEFAIVFPLLLLFLFGIFEFSRIMFAYSAAVSASREAARYGAAIYDTGGGIPQYEDCAGIRDTAKRIGKYAGITDSEIVIQYSNDSGVYSTSCPPSQEVTAADTISVSINTSVTPMTPVGKLSAIPISSSTSRTILKNVKLGFSGTGAGSLAGELSDVNFKTTSQTAEETKGTISVVVELNKVSTEVVTVPFSVTGTALEGAGEDYLITASPLVINPGEMTATIYITLNNDGVAEGDESLIIGLDTPINATKGPQNIHTVTIVDPPDVYFTTVSSVELESATSTALMIELSKGSSQDVTVSFVTSGTATWGGGADYTTSPSSVVISSGTLSEMLMVTINNDSIDENDEDAVITLDSPINALIGLTPSHTMTIIDDDAPPLVSFFTPNQVVSEEIGTFTTSLTLSEISGKTITVPYTTSGTTIPEDYIIHNLSPIVIPPGASTADINMSILEGDGYEEDETLILTLGSPTNASLGAPAVQTIVITEHSDQPTVTFVTSTESLVEGNQLVEVDVYLSNAWSDNVIIPYTLSGTAQAGAGGDYSISGSPLIIPVGWTQGSIQIQVVDDEMDEETEDLVITMGEIQNGTPGAITTYQLQIIDNDSPPEVYFTSTNTTREEDSGTVIVSVGMSSPSVHTVSVPLVLSGSASQGSDYSISTTTLEIPPGSITENFQITLIDDVIYDPGEKVTVNLGSPTNASLGSPATFTLSIDDNELPPCQVGVHLLTVETDSISLSMVNEGENVTLTGGSITWPPASPNNPRLNTIQFGGSLVFSGSEKPTYYSFVAWESFSSLATETISFGFDGALGSGPHTIVTNFQNLSDGSTCSVTENFNNH